jgi:hypothetical protein
MWPLDQDAIGIEEKLRFAAVSFVDPMDATSPPLCMRRRSLGQRPSQLSSQSPLSTGRSGRRAIIRRVGRRPLVTGAV